MLIGEVARRSGVSARMLRHYESLGLVRPSGRTGSGYREYSGKDLRRIFHIESLRSLGLSLREIGRALEDPGFTPSALVGDLIRQTRERIEAETELLTRLRRIDATDPADWEDVLQVVALLQALGAKSANARQRAALSSVDEVPVPVEALVEAALSETEPNVAGALRWALARSGDGGPALLAKGLGSPVAAVRERAVQSLAEMPGDEATAQLRDALANPDVVVRGYAALTLGTRGVVNAVPTLIDMIVEGRNDTDAADALSVLASDKATADQIATGLVDRLAHDTTKAPARGRLTQALAGIPGTTASRALMELSHDGERAVALTAAYLLQLRDTR
ncbi:MULTISPECIES: MerR family transcriptional regulator [unclassified Streptomyces]|uniref:MerR family transcriptional regulator n=1 Tax=unclassified Streptomyces TaxID=2593676 RepID=UPI00225771FD|nr:MULTISPECIES: MerR family transcriptional regulator [unclassified Streptomyces]WSP53308.1 MerR family transcriptional regulator [Streptomyces sp. NBC_01241]WSU26014.1 MerR family transcriptional regulator [Streptomyces sp. NBC_01108]MCX4784668.1 MerR family transcriptional regulator [Streptomyces sp. NBC_01221]MCX4799369.1 MerR family transcriptional regulator [Streptomyces sp. NBC_01242]WSJ40541.1 MerR family transcriptional regulator [Streptomyces sp. NBC_01321]